MKRSLIHLPLSTVICILLMILVTDGRAMMMQDTTGANNEQSDVDMEALVKELYGEEKEPALSETAPTPVSEAPRRKASRGEHGMLRDSFFKGTQIQATVSSPYAVSPAFSTWYSYVDWGIVMRLPYHTVVENIDLYFNAEVSSFNFENSLPEGGLFSGYAYIMRAHLGGERAAFDLGFGFWDGTMGSMLEFDYTFWPANSIFARIGTRGVVITDLDPLGPVWWLDLHFGMGLAL